MCSCAFVCGFVCPCVRLCKCVYVSGRVCVSVQVFV